jgi:hypothetical protein
MLTDERILGHWQVDYCPPCGGCLRGQLSLSGCRLNFRAAVAPDWLAQRVAGPLDACSAAFALDLDPGQAEFDGTWLTICLPRADLAGVALCRDGLRRCVSVTIKDNGSIHQFAYGLLPNRSLASALGQFFNSQVA